MTKTENLSTPWTTKLTHDGLGEVAIRVIEGRTEVKYPSVGQIFRSDEIDEMFCEDMYLEDLTHNA